MLAITQQEQKYYLHLFANLQDGVIQHLVIADVKRKRKNDKLYTKPVILWETARFQSSNSAAWDW